jgi:DNA-binding NtrC family response regulator
LRAKEGAWSGSGTHNIRELRKVVYRALLLLKGSKIEAGAITFEQEPAPAPEVPAGPVLELPEGVMLE